MSLSKEDALKKFKAQRCDKFSIVLNDTNDGVVLRNTDYIYRCLMLGELPLIFLAIIKHDMDKDDYGNFKTYHYHIVLVCSGSYRIGTMINRLMECIKGLNENQISIEKCNSVSAQTRYLIHLDDFDKYRYDDADIITNNRDQLDYYLKEVHSINDVNDLIALCQVYKNPIELMRVIGLDNYKRYRIIIKDILEWGWSYTK